MSTLWGGGRKKEKVRKNITNVTTKKEWAELQERLEMGHNDLGKKKTLNNQGTKERTSRMWGAGGGNLLSKYEGFQGIKY